jgi:hypothetical protein
MLSVEQHCPVSIRAKAACFNHNGESLIQPGKACIDVCWLMIVLFMWEVAMQQQQGQQQRQHLLMQRLAACWPQQQQQQQQQQQWD